MRDQQPTTRQRQLAHALGAAAATARSLGSEPLGAGTVEAFAVVVDGEDRVVYVDSSGVSAPGDDESTPPAEPRVWTHPADPHLPALIAVAFGHAAETLFGRLGMTVVEDPTMAGYRPGRRAVLRVETDIGIRWIKVVRPSRVERIAQTHHTLREAGIPVPAVIAWSPQGLMVIDHAPGTAAVDAAWTADGLLDAVDRLRMQLAPIAADKPVRSIAARAPWYAERVTQHNPHWRADVEAIVAALGDLPERQHVTVHGDLHFGQLFLDEQATSIVGVVDVDTCGWGDPAEDTATFIAHSIASLMMAQSDEAARRVSSLIDAADNRWGGDPGLAPRIAGLLLGYAIAAIDAGDSDRAAALIADGYRRVMATHRHESKE